MFFIFILSILRVGLGLLSIYEHDRWIQAHEGRHALCFTVQKNFSNAFRAKVHSSKSYLLDYEIQIKKMKSRSYQNGDIVCGLVDLWPYRPLYNQGLVYNTHLSFPLLAQGRLLKESNLTHGAYQWIDQLRSFFITGIPTHPLKPLISALLLGDSLEQSNIKSVFMHTGTSHLSAISGLHVGVVSMMLTYVSTSKLFRLCGVWSYLVFALFPPSGVRAGLMFTIKTLYPKYSMMRVLCLTVMIHLIYNPYALFSMSCWLSYWAVLLICIILKLNRFLLSLKMIINMVPMTLLLFYEWPINSLVCNLFAIPFLEMLLMPSITLGVIGASLGFNQTWFLSLGFAQLLMIFLEYFSHGMIWQPTNLSWGFIITLQISIWLLTLSKRHQLHGAILFLMIMFNPMHRLKIGDGEVAVIVFNVGQGLSILIKTHHHQWLYDAGPPQTGQRIVIPLLRYYGVKKLDGIIVSHWDLDHRGGLEAIKQSFPAPVITSGYEGDAVCRLGDHWYVDGVRFEFLHPTHAPKGAKNIHSCVLLIQNASSSILIPGDIDQATENRIHQRIGLYPIDLLIAAHHGSQYSNGLKWLQSLCPKHVVFSAGDHNQYHHPHPSVIERLNTIKTNYYITYQRGTLVFIAKKNQSMYVANQSKWHSLEKVLNRGLKIF